ncbi:hypothetical protein RUR77_001380 [Klebsiella oxytoca]|nr:hypothetical protein [Klebsiella oxytoca]
MTTDITELAQREKFEAWAEHACAAPWGYLKKRRTTEGYSEQIYTCMWTAWKAASAELVEALEKAKQHIARQGQILLNQDESLSIRRGELEAAQQERENWHTSFDNERFRADKLKAHIDEMTEEQTASINELSRIIQKEVKAKREAEKRIAELESRTVKLPDDEDGQAYGFGKWSNGKLPATAGTMTIAYCEDAWRAAFEVFASAAGIKVEAE